MNRVSFGRLVFFIILFISFDVNAQKIVTGDKYMRKVLKEDIRKAEQGDPKSQYIIGSLCLLGGEYVKKDIDLGMTYLRKSASQDYSPAYYQLGKYLYAEGNVDMSVDLFKKSLEYYNEADTVYLKKDDAVYRLWEIAAEKVVDGSIDDYDDYDILVEDLVNKMTPDALDLLEYVAEFDDPETIEMLLLYFYSYQDDYAKGVYYAEKAYELNEYYSCFWLGDAYYWGRGVEKDIEKGISYYEEGANNSSYNQDLCRKTLSQICYRDERMDKAFRYSYDYIHKAEEYLIENSSSTGELLQVLAECYRFGKGTEKNVFLAEFYDLIAMTYTSGWREETIADYWGIDLDDPQAMASYIFTRFNSYLTLEMMGLHPVSCIIHGVSILIEEKDFSRGLPYLVNAYYSEDASEEDKLFVAFLMKNLFEPLSDVIDLSDSARGILDEIEDGSIPSMLLEDEDVISAIVADVLFEQIRVFEDVRQ